MGPVDVCKVLVIVGASGSGKSTVAEALGRELGRSWLQVDDLRLALQFSGLLRREPKGALNRFFTPDIWTRSTRELQEALVRVAELMEPSLRSVIHSHVVTDTPVIIEGDGIHPRLARDHLLRSLVENGTIRFRCLSTPPREVIYGNMVRRNRGIDGLSDAELLAQAEAYVAFGSWLESEAGKAGIPIISLLPHESLTERILGGI